MRQRALFTGLCVYVCPDALTSTDFELLECCLRDGGATLASDAQATNVTHVVCDATEFARFAGGRRARFYAVVRPEWVLRAFALQTLLPADTFSADPRLFFSTLAIAAGSIDKDPRKVIDGLIAHFGGQTIEDADCVNVATHVLSPDGVTAEATATDAQKALQLAYAASDVSRQVELWKQWLDERPASLDFSLPGCVVAHVGKLAGLSTTHHVNYAWIEECVRRKQRVAEAPFSKHAKPVDESELPNWKSRLDVQVEDLDLAKVAAVYLSARATGAAATGELAVMRKVSADRLAVMQDTLAGAIVLVAQHLPTQLKEPVSEILKAAKAKVANVPLGDSYPDIVRKVVTNASFVVCRYQSGLEYEEAVRQKKQIVSVYWVLAGLGIPSDGGELREALLQPVKSVGGVPGMESFVITLSGFSSRTVPTREDVQMAIQATGACVLPVLSRSHSTHLLCYEAKGEKFKKAQSWNFENILSPEWLLECLVQWRYVPEGPFCITSGGGAEGGKSAPESAAVAAETEKDETAPAAAVTTTVTTTTAAESDGKAAPSRFDVDDLLDELNEPTPKTKATKKQGGGSLKLGSAAAEVSATLFDTPSKAAGKRTLRGSTPVDANDALESTIPEDFEFQFGKKAKSRGKAKAADRKVNFDEREPETEASVAGAKTKRTTKRKSGGTAAVPQRELDTTMTADNDADGIDSKTMKSDTKEAKKSPVSTGRKRKTPEATTKQDDSASVGATEESAASSSVAPKKKKTVKTTAKASDSGSTRTAPSGASGVGRLFLLTGTREECAINESIIISLGGEVSQVTGRIYDPACTHIITSELKRTEKFVAGCAAGKWILKQSFLDASSAAGRFVDEADHEWGAKEVDVDEMDPRIWPPVCSFWRKARAATPLTRGAFDGWRFLVHPKTIPPAEMCQRIIVAADGEVIPLTSETDLAALATSSTKPKPIVALIHAELSSRDPWLKKLKASKVRCINASFLIDYLTKDQTNRPKVEDYAL